MVTSNQQEDIEKELTHLKGRSIVDETGKGIQQDGEDAQNDSDVFGDDEPPLKFKPQRPKEPPPPDVRPFAPAPFNPRRKEKKHVSYAHEGVFRPLPDGPPPLDDKDFEEAKMKYDLIKKQEEDLALKVKRQQEEEVAVQKLADELKAKHDQEEAERVRLRQEMFLRDYSNENTPRSKKKTAPPPKKLPPPMPPLDPPKWAPIYGNIFPRGRLEMKISRVTGVGPGTGGLPDEVYKDSGLSGLIGAFTRRSVPSTKSRPTIRSVELTPGRFMRAESSFNSPIEELPVGSVYVRLELNLGAMRLDAMSEVFHNCYIHDFETPGFSPVLRIADALPSPVYPKNLQLHEKENLPPILFYSIWKTSKSDDILLAEGQVPFGYFLTNSPYSPKQISLPLRNPLSLSGNPETGREVTAWIQAEVTFIPSRAGILSVTVHEARELYNTQTVGTQDPFPVLKLGNNCIERGSICKEGGIAPQFNHEELVLWVEHGHCASQEQLELQIMNAGIVTGNALIGSVIASVEEWTRDYDVHEEKLQLQRKDGSKKEYAGTVSLTHQFYPAGQLTIRVLEGRNIASEDVRGGNDAYVRIDIPGKVRSYSVKTGVVYKSGPNPVFNEVFIFDIVDHVSADVSVWDYDQITRDDMIGEVTVDFGGLFRYGLRDAAVSIKTRGAWGNLEDRGILVLQADFVGPPKVQFPQLRNDQPTYNEKERINRYGPTAAELAKERERKHQEQAKKGALAFLFGKADTPFYDEDEDKEFRDEEIEQAFERLDLRKNLRIGKEELRHVLTSLGEVFTDLELNEMIDMLDEDGDGHIAFYEFYQMAKNPQPGNVLWRPRPETHYKDRDWIAEGGIRDLKAHPPPITVVGPDGRLVNIIEPMAQTAMGRRARHRALEIAKKMEKKDLCQDFVTHYKLRLRDLQRAYKAYRKLCADSKPSVFKTGSITFETMCTIFGHNKTNIKTEDHERLTKLFSCFIDPNVMRHGTESPEVLVRDVLMSLNNFTGCTKPQRINFCFSLYDTDRSGSIDVSELIAILKSSHLAMTEDSVRTKAEAILEQADTDGSGSINLEEFVVMATRFPNILFPNYSLSEKELTKVKHHSSVIDGRENDLVLSLLKKNQERKMRQMADSGKIESGGSEDDDDDVKYRAGVLPDRKFGDFTDGAQ